MDRSWCKLRIKLLQSRYIIPIAIGLCLFMFYGRPSKLVSVSGGTSGGAQSPIVIQAPPRDGCSGRYIYVHDLPRRFNTDLLRHCRSLSRWTDMCLFTSNAGLGPPLGNSEGIFSNAGWYATNQFALEVIFHNRMKRYECLTNNSSQASAVFVPFYAGLDVARYLWGYNTSVRDSLSLDLVRWLNSQPEWAVMGGKDHFFVAGRITWDFRRTGEEQNDWGGKLLLLPEAKNMTALVIESSPWHTNDFAIPYPTYFHPSKDSEVFEWIDRMKKMERPWLFSFAGAQRPNQITSIRAQLTSQCRESNRCKLMDCDLNASMCHSPSNVMKTFQSSVFCLQPSGDSYTRRSAFDSMVAGCVPVFFHPASAYVQYLWHLPRNYTRYSVFISEHEVRDGKVSIEGVLSRFSDEQVRAMRDGVIRLIPRLIYADPRSRLHNFEDAFDVAVEGVLHRAEKLRRGTLELEGISPAFEQCNSWKDSLVGSEGEHEWDRFFSNRKS